MPSEQPPELVAKVDQTMEAGGGQSPPETTPESSVDSVAPDGLDESSNDNNDLGEEKLSITVRYQNNTFVLPWTLCTTLQGFKDSLRALFASDDEIKRNIFDQEFYLETADEKIILPIFWESLCRPGWRLRFNTGQPPTDDTLEEVGESDTSSEHEEDEADVREQYINKIQYTTKFHQKDYYGNPDYIHEVTEDAPITLRSFRERSKEAVIQEVQFLVHPRNGGWNSSDPSEGDVRRMKKLVPGSYMKPAILYIHSHLLLNALRAVVEHPTIIEFDEDSQSLQSGSFKYPYYELVNHKDALRAYQAGKYACRANHDEEERKLCDEHIDLLINYLYDQKGIRLKEVEDNWAKKKPTTDFASFWLLMKPGETVYARDDAGELNAYVIDRVSGGVRYRDVGGTYVDAYSILVWCLDFDGDVIKRYSRTLFVPIFDHEQEIITLPVVPASVQDEADGGEARERLIKRGKKFFLCSKKPTFMEYTGRGYSQGWKKYNRSRIVIDHTSQPWETAGVPRLDSTYYSSSDPPGKHTRVPQCECRACSTTDGDRPIYSSVRYSDYDNISPRKTSELTDHQYLVCTSHMYGFVLKDRAYELVNLYGVEEPHMAAHAIDKLVMDEDIKDAIKAIVKTYTDGEGQEKAFSADFIRGKGEGQIILLHGPPGTGKTLTAETVAEFTRRPLVSITVADLGHKPDELEVNLLRFFRDANNWDAVVLLDEADVYLERRSISDLKRNSIVSIFLRALDYFQGILFLTTNRVGHFDEAFISRIHLSIGYSRLDDAARTQIWNNLFNKLKDDHKSGAPKIVYEYEAKEYVRKSRDVKVLGWNGREIRNAFQTAVALAFFDARETDEKQGKARGTTTPEIKERHLTQVVNMSTAFKNYIIATHEGMEDSQLAYKYGIRDDMHGSEEVRGNGMHEKLVQRKR